MNRYFFMEKKLKLILIYINFCIQVIIKFRHSDNIKVCVCTLGKNENKYIREFIQHYKNYGVDKIFLYDNNDIGGEYFQDVISDYIKDNFIQIINFRGKKKIQLLTIKDCHQKNVMVFDWFILIDLDEYIYLQNYNNIKDYLKKKKFRYCQVIHLIQIFYTDNDLLYYDNRTLRERFPIKEEKVKRKKTGDSFPIKSLVKGKIPKLFIQSIHFGNKRYNICNGFGNKVNFTGCSTNSTDFEYYYFIHYFSKSTEEFINKIKRGDAIYGFKILGNIKKYFKINKITIEKINMFEKKLKVNLSKYRDKS